MAKRLTSQDWIERMLAQGWTKSEIAQAVGRDSSLIGQIQRGKKPGANLEPTLRELGSLGKRAREKAQKGEYELRIKPPRRETREGKPAKVRGQKGEKPVIPKIIRPLTPAERAERQLEQLSGADRVVIYATNNDGTKTITLGGKGGIKPETIFGHSGGIGGFVADQAYAQEYEDYDPADWYYEFEEYY